MKLLLVILRSAIALMIFVAISVILKRADPFSDVWWLNTTFLLYILYETIVYNFSDKKK